MLEDEALARGEARSARSRTLAEILAATFVLLYWYAGSGVGRERGASSLELVPLVFNSCAWLLWALSAQLSLLRAWIPRAYDLRTSEKEAFYRWRREALIARAIDVLIACQFLSLAFAFQRFLGR